MITKAQGKACLDMASEIAAGRATRIHIQLAQRALFHMGWMHPGGDGTYQLFDVAGDVLDSEQMLSALSFAAAVAGVQP